MSSYPASSLDRSLGRSSKNDVSLSFFSFFLASMIDYHRRRLELLGNFSTNELEKRLSINSKSVGEKLLELLCYRQTFHSNNGPKREKNLIAVLQWIHNFVWKYLVNRQADGLEKSVENDNEYYIFDHSPLTNRFISVPKEFGSFNPAALFAGIIEGLLCAAEYPCEVVAHYTAGSTTRTVYVIRFEKEALNRDKQQ